MHIVENGIQNNLYNNDRNNVEKNKNIHNKINKNITNKSKKQKRKNKLKTDDEPISKKMKIDDTGKEDSRIKTNTNNIKVENNNEKLVAINKFARQKKNKNKNSQFNQMIIGNRKPDYDDPTMSLNPERLKTYGINAKKLKNKLKYGNKKL